MTGASFFLRSRGKVSGPYDVEGLRRLVRQGTLARIHEISADRVNWSRAAEYEELFPARPAPQAASAAPLPESVDEVFTRAEPSSAASDGRYYYSQNGAAVGPLGLEVLKLLTQNGTLLAGDLVWREGAETGAPAAQIPALATYFSTGTGPTIQYATPATALIDSRGPGRQRALQRFGSASGAAGVIGGGLLLVCLFLPWLSVNNRSFWWWDMYRVPGSGAWAAFCTYLTVAGVALCIVAPLTRGAARGIALVSLSGVAFFFLIGAFLDNNAAGGPAFSVLVPAALAALIGVCSFRSEAPESAGGRAMLGVCGGTVTLGMVTSGVSWASQNGIPPGLPGAVAFGAALAAVGGVAGLAAGVTAFVGLKPRFTPALNRATLVCALGGLVLPAIGVFVACFGLLDAFGSLFPASGSYVSVVSDTKFVVAQALLRVMIVWASVLAVFATGLAELLLASSMAQKQSAA